MAVMTGTRVEAPWHLLDATVVRVTQLTPSFVRVTVSAPELADLTQGPGDQRIKLLLPLADGSLGAVAQWCRGAADDAADWYGTWRALPSAERNPMRTYTIRAVRPLDAELDIDLVRHGDGGPASRWACAVRVGDRVAVLAPNGRFEGDPGGYEWRPPTGRCDLLLAGDETAAPAICAILENLPAGSVATAFIEVPEATDALDLGLPEGVTLTWLPRSGAPVGSLLAPAVRAAAAVLVAKDVPGAAAGDEPDEIDVDTTLLWDAPAAAPTDCPGLYAWLAGEAGVITGLRRHLVRDLGFPRSAVAFMGYWRLGRPSFD